MICKLHRHQKVANHKKAITTIQIILRINSVQFVCNSSFVGEIYSSESMKGDLILVTLSSRSSRDFMLR